MLIMVIHEQIVVQIKRQINMMIKVLGAAVRDIQISVLVNKNGLKVLAVLWVI